MHCEFAHTIAHFLFRISKVGFYRHRSHRVPDHRTLHPLDKMMVALILFQTTARRAAVGDGDYNNQQLGGCHRHHTCMHMDR